MKLLYIKRRADRHGSLLVKRTEQFPLLYPNQGE